MKCKKMPQVVNSSRRLYEPKLDGYRFRLDIGDTTDTKLDGEGVVFDDSGVPRLHLIQQRGKSDRAFLQAAMRDYPVFFYPFDILHYRKPLEHLPTLERKHILAEVLPTLKPNGIRIFSSGGIDVTPRFPELNDPARYKRLAFVVGEGKALYEKMCQIGWEGIVSKAVDDPYVYDNRGLWWKTKKPRVEGKFVICGGCFPRPDSNREGWVGSVILGEVTPKGLVYRGEIGTGFNFAELDWLTKTLKRQDACPFNTRPRPERFWFWCNPTQWVEVDCFERTQDDMLREPVVKRIVR